MGQAAVSRSVGIAVPAALLTAVALLGSSLLETAQAGVWRDSQTGQAVRDAPAGGAEVDLTDPNHAFNPINGGNYFRDKKDCTWKDSKTGKPVRNAPAGGAEVDLTDPNHAFNPINGRNYFYDVKKDCPPQNATTNPPQVGMLIEPKVSFGLGGSSGTTTYDSTGGQAPFTGDWSHSTGQVCGGATFYPGFGIGPARLGLDVNVCSGSNGIFGSGDNTLFTIMRHGPGDVDLHSSTNAIIDVLFKGEVPVGPSNNLFLSAGLGPAFRELNLTLTSNQSFFGGGVPSTSDTTWQTGFAVSGGLSTFVCSNCVAGNPLKVGVEGRARFFPSQSISLRSPAFGFTETGSTGRTTDYSALVTFGVPISY